MVGDICRLSTANPTELHFGVLFPAVAGLQARCADLGVDFCTVAGLQALGLLWNVMWLLGFEFARSS